MKDVAWVALLLAVLCAAPASAGGLDRLVNLSITHANLAEASTAIGTAAGLPVQVDTAIPAARITLCATGVPAGEVLEALAVLYGVSWEPRGSAVAFMRRVPMRVQVVKPVQEAISRLHGMGFVAASRRAGHGRVRPIADGSPEVEAALSRWWKAKAAGRRMHNLDEVTQRLVVPVLAHSYFQEVREVLEESVRPLAPGLSANTQVSLQLPRSPRRSGPLGSFPRPALVWKIGSIPHVSQVLRPPSGNLSLSVSDADFETTAKALARAGHIVTLPNIAAMMKGFAQTSRPRQGRISLVVKDTPVMDVVHAVASLYGVGYSVGPVSERGFRAGVGFFGLRIQDVPAPWPGLETSKGDEDVARAVRMLRVLKFTPGHSRAVLNRFERGRIELEQELIETLPAGLWEHAAARQPAEASVGALSPRGREAVQNWVALIHAQGRDLYFRNATWPFNPDNPPAMGIGGPAR